jgi:signal transduction histidine kinase
VRDSERERIARDIHDDLGQHLLSLKIELSLIQLNAGSAHPGLRQRIDTMDSKLNQTILSLRAIINNLQPLALARGLRAAMEAQLAEFSRLHNIDCELVAESQVFEHCQDEQRDATLFRIFQEALANVARHAHATELRVAMGVRASHLTLTVRDNGVGMGHHPGSGHGLASIGQRVAAWGGQFALDSEAGAGTVLSLSLPLPQAIAAR